MIKHCLKCGSELNLDSNGCTEYPCEWLECTNLECGAFYDIDGELIEDE